MCVSAAGKEQHDVIREYARTLFSHQRYFIAGTPETINTIVKNLNLASSKNVRIRVSDAVDGITPEEPPQVRGNIIPFPRGSNSCVLLEIILQDEYAELEVGSSV
jgi:hypothetical protein